ncbi:hypothetical protein JW823_04050 [bacterium]|nr:hypothetical protein [candidate division CSSED10-310 bacterium]
MARFSEESKPRLEFTLITSAHTIDPSSPLHSYKGPMSAITEDIQPRRFFFFPDQQSAMLFDFLRQITSLKDWSVLVNGRIRPYSQELWLPLLEMAELS